MSLLEICQWLESTALGTGIRESIWWFPVLNVVHLLGMCLAAGTIAWVDLRLLGVGLRAVPVSQVAGSLLKWTWTGFALLFVTGSLLVVSEAATLYENVAARIKVVLLILAGLNVLAFHTTVYRSVAAWGAESVTPPRARLAGAVSLACWTGLIAAGRLIPYVA
jgi:hypothetical protein